MDTIFIGTLASLLGILLGLYGAKRSMKHDYRNEGSTEGSLKSDLMYIKKRTDDVLLEQKDTNRNLSLITERLVRVEESTKSAHKRLDEYGVEFSKHLDTTAYDRDKR